METIGFVISYFMPKKCWPIFFIAQICFAANGIVKGQCDLTYLDLDDLISATVPNSYPDSKTVTMPFDIDPEPASLALLDSSIPSAPPIDGFSVRVFNSIGQLVYEVKSMFMPERLDLGHLREGLYLMRYSTHTDNWMTVLLKK